MRPLDGIRIADFTIHAAGPFCTHLLTQLGAECIKIESAARPDIFRKAHAVYGRMEPATFDQVSSGKLSVRLNLKDPRGRELALRLVSISDLAAESFRPGVMARLGLSYEDLSARKPDIVMVSVSSSGQTGPESGYPGYAPLFGAWGGIGYLTGHADGPPVEMRHVMDHTAGMHAAAATLAALVRRRRTGKGAYVDVAAREIASAMVGDALVEAACGGLPQRWGNASPAMAPHGVYPASEPDRWVAVAVADQAQWPALVAAVGIRLPDGLSENMNLEQRLQHHQQIDQWLTGWTSVRTPAAACERLQAAGIAAHVVWNAADIVSDPHLQARRAIVPATEPSGRPRAAIGAPMVFSRTNDIGIHRGTPELGQDEDYVYGELLGLTRTERSHLEEEGVIA